MNNNADLPDLNVWLALATPDHFHHQPALNYWEQQAAEQVHFCTVTALGLVRLLSQAKLMGQAVKKADEASALLQKLCQQPGGSLTIPASNGWDRVPPTDVRGQSPGPPLQRCLPSSAGHQQRLAPGEL